MALTPFRQPLRAFVDWELEALEEWKTHVSLSLAFALLGASPSESIPDFGLLAV
jgi:hypothetical protein